MRLPVDSRRAPAPGRPNHRRLHDNVSSGPPCRRVWRPAGPTGVSEPTLAARSAFCRLGHGHSGRGVRKLRVELSGRWMTDREVQLPLLDGARGRQTGDPAPRCPDYGYSDGSLRSGGARSPRVAGVMRSGDRGQSTWQTCIADRDRRTERNAESRPHGERRLTNGRAAVAGCSRREGFGRQPPLARRSEQVRRPSMLRAHRAGGGRSHLGGDCQRGHAVPCSEGPWRTSAQEPQAGDQP